MWFCVGFAKDLIAAFTIWTAIGTSISCAVTFVARLVAVIVVQQAIVLAFAGDWRLAEHQTL
jgi:hypothetical protein